MWESPISVLVPGFVRTCRFDLGVGMFQVRGSSLHLLDNLRLMLRVTT